MWSFTFQGHNTCMLGILENISPSERNIVQRPRQNSKYIFDLYLCCFLINITQINFENINRTIQRIISDRCFQLKSRFNVDARALSIPLKNFPFKSFPRDQATGIKWALHKGTTAAASRFEPGTSRLRVRTSTPSSKQWSKLENKLDKSRVHSKESLWHELQKA